jgi:hypothetical protein
MWDLVALFDKGGKCGATHLKPSFALAFVMCGSEGPRLQNDLLIAVVVHVRSCQGQQMFVVHHVSMFVSQNFGPVDCTLKDSTGFEFDRQ